jgi:hypothetical protein
MWIFMQKGFVSIVRHTDKPEILIVRSRFKGHIESVFPKAHVIEDAGRDYRFRTELSPKVVSEAIAKMVLKIGYDNFKACLNKDDQSYFESCIQVYDAVLMNSETDTLAIEGGDFNQFQYLREELNEG